MSPDPELAQTQLEILNDGPNHYKSAPRKKSKLKDWRIRVLIAALVIIAISVIGWVIYAALHRSFYAVIIDAGSSGSRVHAFSFHKTGLSRNIVLDNEFYAFKRPGLSSFADDPVKGAENLQSLLDEAKNIIPKSDWGRTPLSLKATAGLRLLPEEKANRLIEECEKLFAKSGFRSSNGSVSIMSGDDEGIFSWFTVNFLLDRLNVGSDEETFAALDLGGASTQVTFETEEEHVKDLEKHIFNINTFDNKITLYTQSYLGMGINAARNGILTFGQNLNKTGGDGVSPSSVIELHSECVNPKAPSNWTYEGANYLVKGANSADEEKPVVRFSECLKIVRNYTNSITDKPKGLENEDILGFSYYFHGASQVGLVDSSSGGIVTVDSFLNQAKKHCDLVDEKRPLLCLDLIYIYVLLRDGLNLQPDTQIRLQGEINGHKLSWALGAAFDISQSQF